jgi:hypothetical protein
MGKKILILLSIILIASGIVIYTLSFLVFNISQIQRNSLLEPFYQRETRHDLSRTIEIQETFEFHTYDRVIIHVIIEDDDIDMDETVTIIVYMRNSLDQLEGRKSYTFMGTRTNGEFFIQYAIPDFVFFPFQNDVYSISFEFTRSSVGAGFSCLWSLDLQSSGPNLLSLIGGIAVVVTGFVCASRASK